MPYTPPAADAVQLLFGPDCLAPDAASVTLDFDAAGNAGGALGLAWGVHGGGRLETSWRLGRRASQALAWELEPQGAAGANVRLHLSEEWLSPPSGSAVPLELGKRRGAALVFAWRLGTGDFWALAWGLQIRGQLGLGWEVEQGGPRYNLALGGQYEAPPGGAVPLELGVHRRSLALSWGLLGKVRGSAGFGWRLWGGDRQAFAWEVNRFRREALAFSWALPLGGKLGLAWENVHLPEIIPGLYALRSAPYASAGKLRRQLQDGFRGPPRLRRLTGSRWETAHQARRERLFLWGTPPRVRQEHSPVWGQPAEQLRRVFSLEHRTPEAVRRELAARWDLLDKLRRQLREDFRSPPRLREQRRAAWEPAEQLRRQSFAAFANPAQLRPRWTIPWGETHLVLWSERWRKALRQSFFWKLQALVPPGGDYLPPHGEAAHLEIRCPVLDWPGYGVWLFLRENPCPPVAFKRKAWFLMNSLSVVRLPDRAPVPALGASLSSDFDSWAWGLQLTLPDRDALALVSPAGGARVEVEVTINGHVWTALVESFEERRQFGKSGFTVSGRSRSAALAAPYAAARSYEEAEALQAQALAAAEITGSGWTLSWEALDWLVPGGAFAYAQKTPMEALAQIAGGIGARIQTDPADDLLRVLSRYPVAPWEWATATPDKTLSDNLVTSLGLRWEERPAWNGVYVSGASQGVLVQVKRTGSDGTPCAPMIVDPLITAVAAARERGLIELAAGGKQAHITMELPLLPYPEEPGLLLPGQLVEVDDGVDHWRGLVTSVSVQAGRPTVRQTVELERHY